MLEIDPSSATTPRISTIADLDSNRSQRTLYAVLVSGFIITMALSRMLRNEINEIWVVLSGVVLLMIFQYLFTRRNPLIRVELTDEGFSERRVGSKQERQVLLYEIASYGGMSTQNRYGGVSAFLRIDLRTTGKQIRYLQVPNYDAEFFSFHVGLQRAIDAINRPAESYVSHDVRQRAPALESSIVSRSIQEQPEERRDDRTFDSPPLIDTSRTSTESIRIGFRFFVKAAVSIFCALVAISFFAFGIFLRMPQGWIMEIIFIAVAIWFWPWRTKKRQ